MMGSQEHHGVGYLRVEDLILGFVSIRTCVVSEKYTRNQRFISTLVRL
jgi:hypothetical protein